MDLNNAIKEAYELAPASIIYFDTLEILHDDLPADTNAPYNHSIKVVRSYRSITTNDGTFSPVMFDFALPETEGSVRGEMVITLVGIPLAARTSIRTITSAYTKFATIKYRQYFKNTATWTNPEVDPTSWDASASLDQELYVTQIKETREGMEAHACFPDLIGKFFPRRLMTVTTFPGLRT